MDNAYPFSVIQLLNGSIYCRLENSVPAERLYNLSVTEERRKDTSWRRSICP